jgi:hypothetical protein
MESNAGKLESTHGKESVGASMIPKFSIRQLLLMMIAVGVVSACMAGASRGNRIAFGLSVAIIGTILPFAVFSLVHWFSFALASIRQSVIDFHRNTANHSASNSTLATGAAFVASEIVDVEIDPESAGSGDV